VKSAPVNKSMLSLLLASIVALILVTRASASSGATAQEMAVWPLVAQTVLTVLISSLITGGLTAPFVALSLGKAIGADREKLRETEQRSIRTEEELTGHLKDHAKGEFQ
jgi:hypothetical protein